MAYFGLRLYFRQKEYEIVKQRYLEQSIDVISGELESISSAFSHNWARCLDLLKEYRDAPQLFEKEKLNRGFLKLNGAQFNRVAHHRLQVLTGSQIFWQIYQLALSKHLGLNSIVVNEIPHAIKAQIEGNTSVTSDQLVDAASIQLKPMPQASDHFAPLHQAMVQISRLLECERLSFDKVDSFAKKSAVIKIVRDISEHYATDLGD